MRQCTVAFSEPAPVSDRTSISANFSGLARSLLRYVPRIPRRNAERDRDQPRVLQRDQVEVDVGVLDHRQARARHRVDLAGHHGRERDEHEAGDEPAVDAPQRPGRVEPLPEQRVEDRRQVGARRDGEGQRHEERDVLTVGEDAADDRQDPDDHHRDPRDPHLTVGLDLAVLDHRGVDVVRERRRGRDGQAGDHREDRRERDRRDEARAGSCRPARTPAAGPPSSRRPVPP